MGDGVTYIEIFTVYNGSDGEATRALYNRLLGLGAEGVIACNLMRAHKNSARAKVYRGGNEKGRYKTQAYERKEWAIGQLCDALREHADELRLEWGWAVDPAQDLHRYVLYVETPHGQVSFHSATLGRGPTFAGRWDGATKVGAHRIALWCAQIIGARR